MCKLLGFGNVGKIGGIIAVIAWFIIVFYVANQADCVKTNSCSASHLVLFSIIALGMLPASCFVALLVALLFGGGGDGND